MQVTGDGEIGVRRDATAQPRRRLRVSIMMCNADGRQIEGVRGVVCS
jgi:hypothetical protein